MAAASNVDRLPIAVTSARVRGRAAGWRPWPRSIRRPGWSLRPACVETVAAAAGGGLVERCPGVVVAEEPADGRGRRRLRPPHIAASVARRGRTRRPGPPPRSAAGRKRGGARRATSPPTGVTDRWPSLVSMSSSQPSSCRPSSRRSGIAEVLAGGDEGLGEGGVGVRQAGFGPWPRGAAGRASDRPDGGGEQRSGGWVVGCDGEDLRRAERGEGHRPPVLAAPSGAERERLGGCADGRRRRRARAAAVPRPHSARPQQSSTPGSSFHRRSSPRRLWHRPSGAWARSDEGEVAADQVGEHWRRDRVGGRPPQARARRRRGSTRGAAEASTPSACSKMPMSSLSRSTCSKVASGTVTPPPPRRRSRGRRPGRGSGPATAGQRRSGARTAARFAMLAACAGSHSTWRMAAPIAAGSSWSTRRPAPEASSSTAWANAVAMTGRHAATASMSTPEVTCSWESYGRITTSADGRE